MKLALIADLHGNMPAVNALEKDLERRSIQTVWCLGDLVGKGPNSRETCDWARRHCEYIIAGNWDLGIGTKHFPKDSYYWDQLGSDRLAFLNQLPLEGELTFSGLNFRLIHGRPIMPELVWPQSDASLLIPCFDGNNKTYDGVIYADCHRPALRVLQGKYLLNTGSIGNSMGVPRVHYIVLETGDEEFAGFDMNFVSLPYDNEKAAQLAREDKLLPYRDAYINEVLTGIYSR